MEHHVTAPTAEVARQWLERQLGELNELRNASNRAPEFKSWRQNTLTVIQRIWPGDAQRSDRFRRIPFRTPGTRVGDRAVREAYERGCGEAGVLLRQLVGELTLVGIDDAPEPPVAASPATPPAPTTAPTPSPAAPPAPAFNPVMEWLDRLPAPRPHAPRHESTPAPAPPAPTPPAQRHNVRPSRPAAPAPPPLPPRTVETETPPVATPPRAQEPRAPRVESEEVARVTSAFLSASPIFAPRETPAPLPEFVTEPALELAAMALELDTLRVPPARRRALGIALLELARALDEGDPDWAQLRDGVHFVMEYPAVARRALPHLLPFIENAA